MSKNKKEQISTEPIVVLDWTTNTVWKGNVPVNMQNEEVEKWLKEKGINPKNCHWIIGNFTYEDIN